MYRSMHPSPLSSGRHHNNNQDNESDSGTSDNGLGINFYDHRGIARRHVSSPLQVQEEQRGYEAHGVLSHMQRAHRLAPVAKQLQIDSPASDDSVQTPRPTAFPTNLSRSPSVLIEELLEENLRGQAETFVRIASRSTPVRALSSTPRSSFRSASAPVRGLGIATVETSGLNLNTTTFISDQDESAIRVRSPRTTTSCSFNAQTLTSTSRLSRSASIQHNLEPRPRIQNASELLTSKRKGSGFSPLATEIARGSSTFSQLNHHRIPWNTKPVITVAKRQKRSKRKRGPEYFTPEERRAIEQLVHGNPRGCERHVNCTDCRDIEYAYHENKALPLTMDPEQRQKIINNNRSLRNIKNELESLAEHGAITDEAYDTIMSALPAESSLGGGSRTNPVATNPVAANPAATNPAAAANPVATPSPAPVAAFSNLQLNRNTPQSEAPPAYGTPGLPSHSPAPPPIRPEISRATAQYRYSEPGDCNFEPGDQISVLEYMNKDWWLGKNLRTGMEGVFPASYVMVAPVQNMYMQSVYADEKTHARYPAQQQQMQPPAPGPSNPYNSSVPPMAIAEQPTDDKPSKGADMGKKFGKKLGNAAIFGAGATIGGNIVNSIF
ncbi:SH3-domain-containing protein [Diplocarpon rosae]|nr:SH3-domain-containing protein [Diplocarpon rosae]